MSRPAYPPPEPGSIVPDMTAHTHLGQRLAVFTDTAVCDGPCGTDYAIVTDGQTAHAWPLDPSVEWAGPGAITVARTGVTLTIDCRAPLFPSGEVCTGQVVYRLDTPGGWTSDADSRGLLAAYGQVVES